MNTITPLANPPFPPGTIAPIPPGMTMPVGEQIRFLSSRTGAWVLDTYLEMAELGGRTIADLLTDLFDQNGALILSGLNNWMGFWQQGQNYRPGDTFKDSTGQTAYVTLVAHTSVNIASDLAAGYIDTVVTGAVGPMGPPGPPGPAGPPGAPGETVQLIGAFGQVQTPAGLPSSGYIPANWDGAGRPPSGYQFQVGEGMIYKPTNVNDPLYGHIYSYAGTNVSPSGWVDEGSVQGPPGPVGPDGGAYVVVAHLLTSPPDVNNPPINPPNGLLVIDLDDNSFGQASIPAGGTTGQVLAKNSNISYDTKWQTIPAGPTGPQGTPGAVGATGPQGVPGAIAEAPTDGQTYGRKSSSWTPIITTSGGTMTGPVIVPSNLVTASNPNGNSGLQIDGPAGSGDAISGQRAGVLRWRVVLGDSTAESGGNAGSNFKIDAYNDAGVLLSEPLFINRATGQVKVTVSGSTSSYQPHIDSAAGTAKMLYGSVNGSDRWAVVLGSSAAETGGNVGSDFAIWRFTDAGITIDAPLIIQRANGLVTVGNNLQVNGTLTVTGDATLSSGVAMGSVVAASPTDLSRHIALWGTTYGLSITGGTLNLVANGVATAQITSAGMTVNGLTVNGNFTTGQINCTYLIASAAVEITTPSNIDALVLYTVSGIRQWYAGVDLNGTFAIADNTGGRYVFYCNTAGVCVATGNLTCSGNFNTNAISGTNITANGIINVASTNGLLYLTANGVRQWYVGAMNNGQFWITDVSANAVRFVIDTAGTVTVEGSLTTGGNIQCNGSINANGNVIAQAVVQGHGDAGVQCYTPGGNARFYSYGGWVWYFGAISDGSFQFYSATGGFLASYIGTDGVHNFNYMIRPGGNGCWYFKTGSQHAFNWASNYLVCWVGGVNRGYTNLNASDVRLKKNIKGVEGDPLDQLRRLQLISYDMPDLGGDESVPDTHVSAGFSAQQVGEVIPGALIRGPKVPYEKDRDLKTRPYGEDEVLYGYDTNAILARCVGAIQQLMTKIQKLEDRLGHDER